MSYLVGEIFDLSVDCPCGWAGQIATYRAHLVRDHCNISGCGGPADVLASFGYRNPSFITIGVSIGVWSTSRTTRSRAYAHIVEDLRRASRR